MGHEPQVGALNHYQRHVHHLCLLSALPLGCVSSWRLKALPTSDISWTQLGPHQGFWVTSVLLEKGKALWMTGYPL